MPRNSTYIIALTAFLLPSAIQAAELTISLEGIPKSEGTVMIQVVGSEAAFKGDEASVASIMQSAQAGTMSFSLSLPTGTYGIQVMHDLNGNGELDANFVGIPSEPWGFSNNATGNFGPPKWKDVSFSLEDDTVQNIQLNK